MFMMEHGEEGREETSKESTSGWATVNERSDHRKQRGDGKMQEMDRH